MPWLLGLLGGDGTSVLDAEFSQTSASIWRCPCIYEVIGLCWRGCELTRFWMSLRDKHCHWM